ncbi:MAG TPA: ArsA family ATPase [Bryobacteraceae bacterium]|nr:ArsA family ATPase [Bryobacteraceae bacterium]
MSPQARVIVFCGKGGVGKSTLSLAMALKLARSGRRVLVISSHPLPELAVGISLNGLGSRFPEAAGRLFVVHIDPVEQISELVHKHFPMPIVARTVLNSSIFQNLIAVAPGLKEFFFLARLQQLAERRAPDERTPIYDDLIWDAPATGHFLSTLRAARGFEAYLTGPLSSAGAELHRFFSAPDSLHMAAVTQPEEMAIAETIELSQGLRKDFGIRPANVVLNCVSPLCTAAEDEIAGLDAVNASEAMKFAIERGREERDLCLKLATDLPIRQVFVPRLIHSDATRADADLDLLETAGKYLDTALFT